MENSASLDQTVPLGSSTLFAQTFLSENLFIHSFIYLFTINKY